MGTEFSRRHARILAPVAFLLAVTLFVVVVRSALDAGEASEPATEQTAAQGEGGGGESPPPAEDENEQPAEQPQPPPSPPPPPPPAEPEEPEEPEEPADARYHTIQEGETLMTIAEQQGTSIARLQQLNPGIDPYALQVGQRIRVG
jgi:outer membrane biosynthesis protein TonB